MTTIHETINWQQLSLVIGDETEPADEEMKDLYRLFVQDATRRLRALSEFETATRTEDIAKEAHKIRGAAASFGFNRVAALLQTVEMRITDLDPRRIDEMLHWAIDQFDQSVAQVQERYPDLVA